MAMTVRHILVCRHPAAPVERLPGNAYQPPIGQFLVAADRDVSRQPLQGFHLMLDGEIGILAGRHSGLDAKRHNLPVRRPDFQQVHRQIVDAAEPVVAHK